MLTALACPAKSWLNAGSLDTSLLVQNVLQQMKTWPAHMNTYNKLRTPKIDTTRQDIRDISEAPLLILRSFKNYVEKYFWRAWLLVGCIQSSAC
jgi:hypothetical protein